MKKIVIAGSLFFSIFAWAEGTSTSGGGGAFVCRDARGTIQSSLLVDLWEGANLANAWPDGVHALPISIDTATAAEEQFQKALAKTTKISNLFRDAILANHRLIQSRINPLPAGIGLMPPTDLLVNYYPSGCLPEGMMRYNGITKNLDVKTEIFAALATPTDIAAAWMHEAIYKTFREMEYGMWAGYNSNSIPTRKMVSCLFSNDENCLGDKENSSPKKNPFATFECSSEQANAVVEIGPLNKYGYPEDLSLFFTRLGKAYFGHAHKIIGISYTAGGEGFIFSGSSKPAAFIGKNYMIHSAWIAGQIKFDPIASKISEIKITEAKNQFSYENLFEDVGHGIPDSEILTCKKIK